MFVQESLSIQSMNLVLRIRLSSTRVLGCLNVRTLHSMLLVQMSIELCEWFLIQSVIVVLTMLLSDSLSQTFFGKDTSLSEFPKSFKLLINSELDRQF